MNVKLKIEIMDKKLDNINDEIQEWLNKTARSYGTIPPSEEVDWEDDIERIYMGSVPRDGGRKLDNEPHWDKYDICFEDAFGDAISIAHMTDEIILKNDYINAERLIKRYRNVVIGFTNDKKLDSIENEILAWLEETARSYGTIPPSKEVDWHDIEQVYHGYVPRDGDRKLDNKPHWDKYDISFESAFVDSVDITHMSSETLEGDFDTLIHLVKKYRNIVLSDKIASEYKKEEKKEESHDKLYIIVGTWGNIDTEMAHFYTPDKAVQYISENAIKSVPDFKRAKPTDDPKSYLSEYDDYWNELDVDPEFYMKLHIIDLKEGKKSSEVNMLRFMHGVNKNISSEDQYRVFCMFSQLSKEETKGYDCDEMWGYCHTLYATFCDSEFNDDNISEIDAMNKFLENIEERIAWCKDNPPLKQYLIEGSEYDFEMLKMTFEHTSSFELPKLFELKNSHEKGELWYEKIEDEEVSHV